MMVTPDSSERPFSCTENIITTKRSVLEPENIEKQTFLHDNLPSLNPYNWASKFIATEIDAYSNSDNVT